MKEKDSLDYTTLFEIIYLYFEKEDENKLRSDM